MTAKFAIADDFDRTTPRGRGPGRRRDPLTVALIEGHTVFMAGVRSDKSASRFTTVRKAGYRIRARNGERDGVAGSYVWAERNGTE